MGSATALSAPKSCADRALRRVLSLADYEQGLISHDDLARFDREARESVSALRILRPVSDAEVIRCDGCGTPHFEPVLYPGANGRPFIFCPEVGLIPVHPDRLRRWELNCDALASVVTGSLELDGMRRTLRAGRVWLIGTTSTDSGTTEFFLVRGAAWRDASDLLRATARLLSSPAPVILCLSRVPTDLLWHEQGRVVISLAEAIRFEDSRICLNRAHLDGLHRRSVAHRGEMELEPTPVEEREAAIRAFADRKHCQIGEIADWANVVREDLNKWKLGRINVPDRSPKAHRIEKLLQLGIKSSK